MGWWVTLSFSLKISDMLHHLDQERMKGELLPIVPVIRHTLLVKTHRQTPSLTAPSTMEEDVIKTQSMVIQDMAIIDEPMTPLEISGDFKRLKRDDSSMESKKKEPKGKQTTLGSFFRTKS
jgi:hypothetical protein